MPASDYEAPLYRKVLDALARWLRKVRDAVLGTGGQPDASAVLSRRPAWNKEVDKLMPEIEAIAAAGWTYASEQTFVSTSSFIISDMARAENFLRNISNEVYALVVAEMVEGQTAGESVEQLRERIERVLSMTASPRWTNRARVIAQTESNRAWNAGVYGSALYYEPVTGKGWIKIWQTNLDGRERPSHHAADNQTVGLRDYFMVGTPPFPMLYPGDPRAPADEVINCFPGDVVAGVMGELQRTYRRWYEGPMVVVDTASGIRLTGTPNHPVLTSDGWLPLKAVHGGTQLIKADIAEWMRRSEPKVNHMPAELRQIHGAACQAGRTQRFGVGVMDFHSDFTTGEVEIVSLNGDLPSPGGKTDGHLLLDRPNDAQVALATQGNPLRAGSISAFNRPRLDYGLDPPHGICSSRQGLPLFESGMAHADGHGISASTGLDSQLLQAPADDSSTYAELLGQRLLGHLLCDVEVQDDGRVQRDTPSRALESPFAAINAQSLEVAPQDVAAYPKLLLDLAKELALIAEFDEVLNVHVVTFADHVYNLQTSTGMYTGNGIFSKNCRCELDLKERP